MQRTLFDFARKQTVVPSASCATGGGARPPSTSPTRKRTRRSEEAHSGASKSTPVSLEEAESSLSVMTVDEASVPTPAAPPTRRSPSPKQQERESCSRAEERHTTVTNGTHATASTSAVLTSQPATHSSWLADLITNPEWRAFLQPITAPSWRGGEFQRIERYLDQEKAKGKIVLPPAAQIFNAFNGCPFTELKVVLLGQDPYHNLNQAHGLCFSVLPGVPLPPSLKNMYKELTTDVAGFQAPTHGYLQSWSEQGMLMLNATLTVEAHNANSHSKTSGWTHFTDAVIARLSAHHPNRLVFLLWGNYAQQKKKLIDSRRHVVIESVHPSPLSARHGWFGCKCFSACNTALREMGHTPMYWQLPLQVQSV